MALKRFVALLGLGLIASTQTQAGEMGAVSEENTRGIYVEGNVGYANHPYTNDRTTTPGLENQLGILTHLSNINGGPIGGVDVGYQFTRYLAIEGGWSYIPTAGYNRFETVQLPVAQSTFTLPKGKQVYIKSGIAYIVAKGSVPIYGNLDAFGKVGTAYAYNHVNTNIPASLVNSPTARTINHSNFWNGFFGFGLQYALPKNLSINVQYDFVPGYRDASANHFITPDIQLITFGLGYKFFM